MTPEEHKRLELRRDELKDSVESLGRLLILFIVVVVIGLIIELTQPILLLVNRFDPWVLAELIGSAGVAIGVTGELAVEWNTHRKERELLRIDAEIEREDKLQLQSANLRIAELQDEAAKATLE